MYTFIHMYMNRHTHICLYLCVYIYIYIPNCPFLYSVQYPGNNHSEDDEILRSSLKTYFYHF